MRHVRTERGTGLICPAGQTLRADTSRQSTSLRSVVPPPLPPELCHSSSVQRSRVLSIDCRISSARSTCRGEINPFSSEWTAPTLISRTHRRSSA
ncbi:MAG: hypothetical protein JWO82_1367 [Akkermansiaceae bacterium]|nr:hypothetical protein [Akkermansiaceae bacterium]